MKKIFIFLINIIAALNTKGDYWTQKSSFPGGGRIYSFSFSIGNKGYVGSGHDNVLTWYNDFWEYDPTTNLWTQKANFAGNARISAVGFSIGDKGYAGLGNKTFAANSAQQDLWEYDTLLNIWTQKADFGGGLRSGPTVFTLGSKCYVGMGSDTVNISYNDLWEFDPFNNIWTQKANLPGVARSYGAAFSLNNKGYITAGLTSSLLTLKDLWEYDASLNSWTQKAFLPGSPRAEAVAFSICNKGYLGTGYTFSVPLFNDLWQYEPFSNQWIQKANVGGPSRVSAMSFSIGTKGYVGLGRQSSNALNDFWEYTPDSVCAVGIDELTFPKLDFTISPNPAKQFININYSFKENKKVDLTISDTNGKKVLANPISTSTVNLKGFINGIYFVEISDGKHKVVKMFVKE